MTLVAFGVGACKPEQAGEGLALKEGLRAAEEAGRMPPLTDDQVDTPAALERVLRRPLSSIGRRLDGVRQAVKASWLIESGGEREVSLSEELELCLDSRGNYSLHHRNRYWSRQDQDGENGRACWWLDGALYTARLHGPATRIPIRDYEQDRCLESALEPLVGWLQLIVSDLDVEILGRGMVAGRKTVTVALRRAGRGIELPEELPLTHRAPAGDPPPSRLEDGAPPSGAVWGPRSSLVESYARPITIAGRIDLDVETGAPMSAEVSGRLLLRKWNRDAELAFRVVLESRALDEPIKPPESVRPYDRRPRVFVDRSKLLGEHFKEEGSGKAPLPKPGDAPPLKPFDVELTDVASKQARVRGSVKLQEDLPAHEAASELEDSVR